MLVRAGARVCHEWRAAGLRLDRVNANARARPRVLAIACWDFPIYSQTFVYQELTQLLRDGFALRLLYARRRSRDHIPGQFSALWRASRQVIYHAGVAQRDVERFRRRVPGRVDSLMAMLADHAGMSAEQVERRHEVRNAFTFARMVEAYRPDYLHSYFFYEGTLFSLVASHLLDIPRGVSCYADHMLQDWDLKLLPLHLHQSRLIVATSERIKKELVRIAPAADADKILVKPNAIDSTCFPVPERSEPRPGQPYRLVCVSRIEPKKGLLDLVDAVHRLRARRVEVEAHLIGGVDDSPSSREYAQAVDRRIVELGLSGVVHREGRRSHAEINRLFGISHLCVAPFVETPSGDKDGIPTAVLEAMATGLPVVATDAGSICEAIEDGREGLIVPQRDPDALADAVGRLIAAPRRRAELGSAGARRVRDQLDVKVCEQAFHLRVREIMARRNRGSAPRGRVRERSPVVSVITIFFNAERFIEQAIESVLNQDYEAWELLLVDDGSTDGSTSIAERHARSQPGKVKYLAHPGHQNRGMSASRNLGIRHARGEYIAFLDSDDAWFPHKLKRQVSILEDHPDVGMLYGATQYWHGWTGRPEDRGRDHIPDLGLVPDRVYEPPDLSTGLYPLGTGTAPCPSDLMLRRDLAVSVGGFEDHFDGNKQLYEDQAFLAKVYLNARVYVSSECWDRYRVHPDSCSSRAAAGGTYHEVREYFLTWLERYLGHQESVDSAVAAALQRALRPYEQPTALPADEPPSTAECPDGDTQQKPAIEGDCRDHREVPPVNWGTLRRLTPISRKWGFDRGQAVDRYYIERFLAGHDRDIRGHVLEVEDDMYTRRFERDGAVTAVDVLHVVDGNPKATMVGDLTSAPHIPSGVFDCIILTQTLQLIYDTRAALATLHRILRPGGVLLATFPGISRISHEEWGGSWFWCFTTASTRRLFAETFPGSIATVTAHGNVLVANAFLQGLAVEDLKREELDHEDPDYEVLITARVQKRPPP